MMSNDLYFFCNTSNVFCVQVKESVDGLELTAYALTGINVLFEKATALASKLFSTI